MSLHLELRWQAEDESWDGERVDCVDGMFSVRSLGHSLTVEQARQMAKASSFMKLERRPYALRIGFSD